MTNPSLPRLRRRFARTVVAVAALAGLGGCGASDDTHHYDIADDVARAMRRDATPPLKYAPVPAAQIQTYQLGDGTVVWAAIGFDGNETMRMTALATPGSGGGTDVVTRVLPPEGPNHDKVAKGMSDHPAIANVYQAIVDEDVDATLTKRAFDGTHIYAALGGAMAAMLPQIRQGMDAAAKQSAQQDQDNLNHAYANEGRNSSQDGGSQDWRRDPTPQQQEWQIQRGVQPDAVPTPDAERDNAAGN